MGFTPPTHGLHASSSWASFFPHTTGELASLACGVESWRQATRQSRRLASTTTWTSRSYHLSRLHRQLEAWRDYARGRERRAESAALCHDATLQHAFVRRMRAWCVHLHLIPNLLMRVWCVASRRSRRCRPRPHPRPHPRPRPHSRPHAYPGASRLGAPAAAAAGGCCSAVCRRRMRQPSRSGRGGTAGSACRRRALRASVRSSSYTAALSSS